MNSGKGYMPPLATSLLEIALSLKHNFFGTILSEPKLGKQNSNNLNYCP